MDGQQDGHVFHLTNSTGQLTWSGTVDGRPILPFNRPSNAEAQLVVRFADDGKAVVPSTSTSVETLHSLTELARQAQQHCAADSGQSPLSSPAVPAQPRGSNAIPGCSACKFGCANGFLGCGVTTGIACAGLLFVPIIGVALFLACEGIGILVCVIQEVNCAIGCNASDQCCPIPCGSKCCDSGAMCADKAKELCCDSGTTPSGDTCCDNATETPNPAGGCCLRGEPICGNVCCALGQTCFGGTTCCDASSICQTATGPICCGPGFQCQNGPNGGACVCPTTPCFGECCGIDSICAPADQSCCNTAVLGGGGTSNHLCGGHCCNTPCTTLQNGLQGCCPFDRACPSAAGGCCAFGKTCGANGQCQ